MRSDKAKDQAAPRLKPLASVRRPAVELLVVAVATGVHLTSVVALAVRDHAVPGIVRAARVGNRCARRVLALAGSGTRRGRREAQRWWVDLRAAAEPLQQDALSACRQLIRVDAPKAARATGKVVEGTAHGVAAGAALVARAAARMAPACGAPSARRLAVIAPWILVPVLVLTATAWFAPGPVLQLAARQVDLQDPPFRPLPQRSAVLTADGTPLGTVHAGENRRVVPLASVPPLVRRLVLAAEDHRFFEHEGFDQPALVRAGLANARAGEVRQGGSTISQQLVKQNIVGDDRTPLRKVRELILAVAVEKSASKNQLLERYLNQVYFGAGAYGIAAAAETYFGTTPEHLRPEQGALLAALIRSPTRLDPWTDRDQILVRRNEVLRFAGEEGVLDDTAVQELSDRDLGLLDKPATPQVFHPDLMGVVEREIARRPELGPDPSSRLRRFRSGGWRVETTISSPAQAAAERGLDDRPAPGMPSSGAVALVEPGTGRIRALHSRRPPQLAQLELASSGRRQPGSAFKPLAAVAALEAGLDPAQPLEGRTGLSFRVGKERWPVDNFGDRDHGSVDLARALRDSVNSAFAQLGVAVGTEQLAELTTRFGIDAPAALGPPSERPGDGPGWHPPRGDAARAGRRLCRHRQRRRLCRAHHHRAHRGCRRSPAPGAGAPATPCRRPGDQPARSVDAEGGDPAGHRHPGLRRRLGRVRQDGHEPGRSRRVVRRCRTDSGRRSVGGRRRRQDRHARGDRRRHRRPHLALCHDAVAAGIQAGPVPRPDPATAAAGPGAAGG